MSREPKNWVGSFVSADIQFIGKSDYATDMYYIRRKTFYRDSFGGVSFKRWEDYGVIAYIGIDLTLHKLQLCVKYNSDIKERGERHPQYGIVIGIVRGILAGQG